MKFFQIMTGTRRLAAIFLNDRIVSVCCVAGLLIAMAGCGGPTTLKPRGGAEDAVEATTSALAAWKSGQTAEELLTDLDIIATDMDWKSGSKLVDFKADKTANLDGINWQVNAVLTLRPRGQNTQSQVQAIYSVTLEPHITVVRMDNSDSAS